MFGTGIGTGDETVMGMGTGTGDETEDRTEMEGLVREVGWGGVR